MKNIYFLFKANAFKAEIVIDYLLNNTFYKGKYNIFYCFETASGKNIDIIKNTNKNLIIIGKDAKKILEYSVDIIIACGWGWKIPSDVIMHCKIAALNCHSSFLPDYKGGSVYFYQWANAEKEAGSTIHLLSDDFDEGNLIVQTKVKINLFDNPMEILKNVSQATAKDIKEAIKLVEKNHIGTKQIGGRYFFQVSKKELYIKRTVNILLRIIGFDFRWLTKHKTIM